MLGKVLPIINIIVIPVVIATASKVIMSIQFTFVLKLHLVYINSMEYSTNILKSLYTKVFHESSTNKKYGLNIFWLASTMRC
jgi:hypothetical protein